MTQLLQLGAAGGRLQSKIVKFTPLGAVAGQLSQALGSFVLQVIAARALGADGLGVFALVYSILVLAAALSTGLIGDSLTILDRQSAPIRSGLQRWLVVTGLACGMAAAVVAYLTHLLTPTDSALFGVTLAVFLVEDVLRRLLMATMRFWSLVAVDAAGMVTSLATLAVYALLGQITLESLLLALCLGQVVATAVAVLLLPTAERTLAPWGPAAMATVGRFGVWRGAQQGVRPTMLLVARVLIVGAVGTFAFGQLEATRVFMAPAMLMVQGVGSYLISSYARLHTTSMTSLIRRADHACVAMFVLSLGMGAVACGLASPLGSMLTAGKYPLGAVPVFGWAVYAASTAAALPFASLAAIRGRHALIFAVRAGDSILSIGCLILLIVVLGAPIAWAPYALAIGALAGALYTRFVVLEPMKKQA